MSKEKTDEAEQLLEDIFLGGGLATMLTQFTKWLKKLRASRKEQVKGKRKCRS